MKVTVGTFNFNNLFSRFNFAGVIDEIQAGGRTGRFNPAFYPLFRAAWIDRRTKPGGDGSDHDPAWVEMDV